MIKRIGIEMVSVIFLALIIVSGIQHLPSIPAPISAEPCEELEWVEYHAEAYAEYADEFTALFNSYEFKRAANGAPMIRRQGESSFKFSKRG